MCSKIEFSEDVKKQRKEVTGFIDYIREEKIHGKNITYFEYIFGEEPELHLDHDFVFDTDREYVVIYSALKSGWIREKGWPIVEGLLGIVSIVAAPFTGGGSIAIFTARLVGTALLGHGSFVAVFKENSGGYKLLSIVPYEVEAIYNLGCTEFKGSP